MRAVPPANSIGKGTTCRGLVPTSRYRVGHEGGVRVPTISGKERVYGGLRMKELKTDSYCIACFHVAAFYSVRLLLPRMKAFAQSFSAPRHPFSKPSPHGSQAYLKSTRSPPIAATVRC